MYRSAHNNCGCVGKNLLDNHNFFNVIFVHTPLLNTHNYVIIVDMVC